jgi:hypothetical protein
MNVNNIANLLGFNKNEIPWNSFKKIVSGKEETELQNKEKLEIGIDLYESTFNVKLENRFVKKTHKDIPFIEGTIHAKTKDFLLYFEENINTDIVIDNYNKCRFDLLMEIFDIKSIYYCKFYKDENGITMKRKLLKCRKMWFISVSQKILRIKKEIDLYKKEGIEKHPVEKMISSWNLDEEPLPVLEVKPTLSKKEEPLPVLEVKPTKKEKTLPVLEVKPTKKEKTLPVLEVKPTLPKRELKKEDIPYTKKNNDTKPSFVIDKVPKFEFIKDPVGSGSKLLVL